MNYLAQKINRAKVEKPCSRPNKWFVESQPSCFGEAPWSPRELRNGVETTAPHPSCPAVLRVPRNLTGLILDPVKI